LDESIIGALIDFLFAIISAADAGRGAPFA